MRLSDFILLTEDEKKFTVLNSGTLIAKRSNISQLIFLFQLEGYYVETYCNFANKSIEEYRVFDSIKTLNPYLEAIQIDHLLN